MRSLLAQLRALFDGLAPRERLLVMVATALIAGVLVWMGLLQPIGSWMSQAERRAEAGREQLERAALLRRDFDRIQGRLAEVEARIQRSRAGDIFTILERLARQSAIKVDSMEPQASPASDRYRETKVQVALQGVTLAQMVKYLHGIESAPELLSIKKLSIRTRPDKPELLNVTFTVSSFEPV